MSQVTTPTEPGWLPDPSGRYEWRYWDGGWTNRVANSAPKESATSESATAAESAAPSEPAESPAPEPAGIPAPAAEAAAPSESTNADASPVATGMSARDAVPRVPFGADPEPGTSSPETPPRKVRRSPWVALVGFFRSFADQPESYHHPLARQPLPPDPRGERMVATAPGNYGLAMIVALAAAGIVVGAYLPWIAGTIGLAEFTRSGFDNGLGVGYSIGAVALAISAMLSVQKRPFRWLTIIIAFAITGFVVRDVLQSYDRIQQLNQSPTVDADVGWGLWIMIVASAIAMIGAVRLSEDEKIG